jgi:hypothetical protein
VNSHRKNPFITEQHFHYATEVKIEKEKEGTGRGGARISDIGQYFTVVPEVNLRCISVTVKEPFLSKYHQPQIEV